MTIERQRLGLRGEQIGATFLEKLGYAILARNYRCRLGEVDIIAKDGKTLVFIEVKTRVDNTFGSPAAAVTLKKQRQIARTAQHYLAKHGLFETPARFDVIAIVTANGGSHQIEHIADAFELCE